MNRSPRLALMTLPSLDHFVSDVVDRLPAAAGIEVRQFRYAGPETMATALAWAGNPATDMVWFEFCWPPFPAVIEATDFGGRRVIVRIHRVEATETSHVATAPWGKIDDAIVVSEDMKRRVLKQAPEIAFTTRLHLVPNGVDTERFRPAASPDPKRIGWAGLMTLRKNPALALQVLMNLHRIDPEYRLHMCSMQVEPFAMETFWYQVKMFGLENAIVWDGHVPQSEMPDWHRQNMALLHTSLHESFGYVIAEAALCGCRVAVLDFPGARTIWPEAILYRSVDEAATILTAADQTVLRDHVLRCYGTAHFLDAMKGVLRSSVREDMIVG